MTHDTTHGTTHDAGHGTTAHGTDRPVRDTTRETPSGPDAAVVLRPADAGYDEEVAGFQTGFRFRPALVVGAAHTDEVRSAVRYAAGRGLPLAVQATGHGLPGASEGGVLVTTRRMDGVRVDPAARTARIEAGVRWSRVAEAAAPHGLAPLNGSAPDVGAVGYTLGGGLGLLARQFGYTADHVRALEVVTADGELRTTSARSEPELHWALLGGGHRLGVVTAMEVGLVPVTRLYGGSLMFADDRVDEAVRTYLEWTRTVPEELTSSIGVMVCPDLPFLPAQLRGRYTASIRVAYSGSAEEGERLVAPLRAIGPAVADSMREMAYGESPTIHNDPERPHAYYGDSLMMRDLDAGSARTLLALTGPRSPVWTVTQINHLGGALARRHPNAVPHRDARFLVRVLSGLDGTAVEAVRARYEEVFAALGPSAVGRSLNFTFAAGDRTRGLYDPETEKRLAVVKERYDPANLFRRS
ncbi:FAD-binding oxidoreductase [Streptomyces sp. SP18CS02]|uniref:FAD-binding oxidoreductase n=1 Tax=Streptomyces sp. SP18CS02 TaxID=3002531 RepID=UPI002E793E91|nr:FAD-binding oxidoreductase [Streptomyces sp. SP18CS02]MEE1753631.1 FAD-binding oxidoreductase [Streptomyces sp. SP18CS02]